MGFTFLINHARIAERRGELGLTMEEAANRGGLSSRQQWNDVESGRKKRLSAEVLYRMALALAVRMEDLIIEQRDGDKPAKKPR
jgi:transcriptional regulator with XRE-family HTH domain